MIEIPADRHRDPARIAKLTNIAADIFARHEVDFGVAQRAGGWSNATWLAGGLALRISVELGTDNIRREARLASLLPPEVGYPQIIETGVNEGHEWSLAKEASGQNLGELWSVLDWDNRIVALRQLWDKAQAVHSVSVSAASTYTRKHSPFYASNAEEAEASAARLQEAGVLASRQVAVLVDALDRFWTALPSAPRVLNHGDLCRENVLWHDGQVVALFDLEFAVIAPIELDLNELLKCAYAPPERDDSLPDSDGAGLQRMQEAVADLAVAALANPGGTDLLLGYAILLELWSMENWLSKWDGQEPFDDWQPYRTLTALADGAGGYLAPVLARAAASLRGAR
jgi:scyllo-inosamine 4-kinase